MKNLFFILDQGTTQHKLVIFDENGRLVDAWERRAPALESHTDGLSFDALELTAVSNSLIAEALIKYPNRFFAFGFANQGETVLAWEKSTGKPLSRMVSWQCQDAASLLDEKRFLFPRIQAITGLKPSPYFSAAKLEKLLRTNVRVQEALVAGDLILGTLDTWMISQWTKSRTLVTDPTTACRTQLYDIDKLTWSDELMVAFHLKPSYFSRVLANDALNIECDDGPFLHSPLPLLASLCDQPAALIGHGGLDGQVLKISFGTGAFVDLSTRTCLKEENLLTSVLSAGAEAVSYYLEGGVLSFASAIEWMEKNLQISRTEIFSALNQDLPISVLPAFSGLGAPFFLAEHKTTITGVGLEHTAKDIAVAGTQALVFRIAQIIEEMQRHVEIPPQIEVDGGLSGADSLIQFLADVCQRQVVVRNHPQMTAEGVAKTILKKIGKSGEIEAFGSSRMIDVNNNFPARKYREWKDAFLHFSTCLTAVPASVRSFSGNSPKG